MSNRVVEAAIGALVEVEAQTYLLWLVARDIERQGTHKPSKLDFDFGLGHKPDWIEVDGRREKIYSSWAHIIAQVVKTYPEWIRRIDNAIQHIKRVAPFMDGNGAPSERWSFKVMAELMQLKAVYGPGGMGADGLGLVRCHGPVRPELLERFKTVQIRKMELYTLVEHVDCKDDREVAWRTGSVEDRVRTFLCDNVHGGPFDSPTVADAVDCTAGAVRTTRAWITYRQAIRSGNVLERVQKKNPSTADRLRAEKIAEDEDD